MKLLETEFVQNSDKRGDMTFKQVKRNEYAALYRRYTMEGRPVEFEVFQIKEAGGQVFEKFYEPYEQYPGAAAFGKTAWTVLDEARANLIYDEITAGKGSRKDAQRAAAPIEVKVKRTDGKRGRPRVERPAIILPKKQFSMKDLLKVNVKGWSQPTLYIELMKLVKQDKVVESGRKAMGRGRPVVFYKIKA